MPAAKKTIPKTSPVRKVATRKPAAAKTAAAPPERKAPVPLLPPRPAEAAKPDKPRKTKLLRDSFTIPKTEYGVLEALKVRAAKAGHPAKKSEVLRAGVKALSVMGDVAFLAALAAVPAIKTGRPAKS
jgi:plasmid stability protein